MAKKNKKKVIKTSIDLEAALGKGAREAYLEQNPHGYAATKKVHKNKKKYNRKEKHKKDWKKFG